MVRLVPGLVESDQPATLWVSLFNFQCLCHLWPSGLTFLWGGLRWKFLRVWWLPGAPIWRGLVQRRTPIAGSACWYYVLSPWNPRCTGVWPTPKWWQSYSWRIRISVIRVAATLLRGDWLNFLGHLSSPHIGARRRRQRRGRSVYISGGMPPGTFYSWHAPLPADTSP